MSTKVMSGSHFSYAPSTTSFPPDYASEAMIELDALTPSTTTTSSPPTYAAATEPRASPRAVSSEESAPASTDSFVPTLQLQIETPGKPLIGLPMPTRPDPIPIYNVSPSGERTDIAYLSCRYTRNSGNCYLVRGDDAAHVPVATTTYRFGPGKPPKLRLLGADSPSNIAVGSSSSSSSASPELGPNDAEFEITGKSITSRAVALRTPYGTFEWRYASRADRKAQGANSLLVLERVVRVALAGGATEEQRAKIAQLVRNDELRSTGTNSMTAGNGGRLMVDMREWADSKGESEMVLRTVVASAVCMLKKEVDRRRMHQIMVLGAAASGGS